MSLRLSLFHLWVRYSRAGNGVPGIGGALGIGTSGNQMRGIAAHDVEISGIENTWPWSLYIESTLNVSSIDNSRLTDGKQFATKHNAI